MSASPPEPQDDARWTTRAVAVALFVIALPSASLVVAFEGQPPPWVGWSIVISILGASAPFVLLHLRVRVTQLHQGWRRLRDGVTGSGPRRRLVSRWRSLLRWIANATRGAGEQQVPQAVIAMCGIWMALSLTASQAAGWFVWVAAVPLTTVLASLLGSLLVAAGQGLWTDLADLRKAVSLTGLIVGLALNLGMTVALVVLLGMPAPTEELFSTMAQVDVTLLVAIGVASVVPKGWQGSRRDAATWIATTSLCVVFGLCAAVAGLVTGSNSVALAVGAICPVLPLSLAFLAVGHRTVVDRLAREARGSGASNPLGEATAGANGATGEARITHGEPSHSN